MRCFLAGTTNRKVAELFQTKTGQSVVNGRTEMIEIPLDVKFDDINSIKFQLDNCFFTIFPTGMKQQPVRLINGEMMKDGMKVETEDGVYYFYKR